MTYALFLHLCLFLHLWVMLTSFVWTESCQHLVEDVVVFLTRQRTHHPRLVQEVTVYFCTIEGAIRDLYLDEVPLIKHGAS